MNLFSIAKSNKYTFNDKKELFNFYYEYLNKTYVRPFIKKDLLSDLAKSFHGKLVEAVVPKLLEVRDSLRVKIIELLHRVIQKGYIYNDFKFDNFGYKYDDNEIILFFLDIESGLYKINYKSYDEIKRKYNDLYGPVDDDYIIGKIVYNFLIDKYYIDRMSIFGKNNLPKIFGIESKKHNFDINNIKMELENSTELQFYNIYLDEGLYFIRFSLSESLEYVYVIELCDVKLRLFLLDENKRHCSDEQFNKSLNKIDHLFDNLADLIKFLKQNL